MKTVNIYIETTIKSPIVKDGKYASALVFTRSNGEEAYRVMKSKIKNYGKCTLRKRRNTKRNFAFAPAMIIRDC